MKCICGQHARAWPRTDHALDVQAVKHVLQQLITLEYLPFATLHVFSERIGQQGVTHIQVQIYNTSQHCPPAKRIIPCCLARSQASQLLKCSRQQAQPSPHQLNNKQQAFDSATLNPAHLPSA
jgi:hypothetical protein